LWAHLWCTHENGVVDKVTAELMRIASEQATQSERSNRDWTALAIDV
jgi:hypothetical protein